MMSLGWTNVIGSFIDLMNLIFKEFTNLFTIQFIHDILVYSKSEVDHMKHLNIVL